MGGGLMQLVAYGAQDIYLTGNPQITFFKVVYRRHTNFAMEAVSQTFAGQVKAGSACNVSATISRNGDLVHRVYLELSGAGVGAVSTHVSFKYVDHVELEIGGQLIDRHYGDWMNIWHSLSRNNNHDSGYASMIGDTDDMTELAATHADAELYVPLQF